MLHFGGAAVPEMRDLVAEKCADADQATVSDWISRYPQVMDLEIGHIRLGPGRHPDQICRERKSAFSLLDADTRLGLARMVADRVL